MDDSERNPDQVVAFDELLVNIKSTRNVNEIKQKLERDQWQDANEKKRKEERAERQKKKRKRKLPFERAQNDGGEEAELEEAVEQKKRDRMRKKVLEAPVHRQAQRRIESKLAYRQSKNELRQWQPVVDALRVAEQLQFPQDERRDEDPLKIQTAEERAKAFTPRTELELRIAEVLGQSKHNIRNDEEFSQAERELLQAMDLKTAQKKCEELRKMRALVTFHAAKLKRQSRIKSKMFHRIKKRQQRREIVKELETLLVRDSEKAKERIEELEKDRAFERATLKHRGTNKWTKQIRKFASRNPELRKSLEEQLRFGRELKGKHGAEGEGESDSDTGDDDLDEDGEEKPLSTQTLVEMAADEAAKTTTAEKPLPSASENPFFRSALENIRRERKTLAKQAKKRAAEEMANKTAEESVEKDGEVENEKEELPAFLDLNVRQIVQIPAELADGNDSDTDVQHAFLAEAYEDDDVLDEFQARKARVEEQEGDKEKPTRYSQMRGWGSWTGAGISEEREKQRMDRILVRERQPKRRERQRKDANRPGLIIREQVSEGIKQLQPRDVPHPFTRVQDFEAYIQQPLGRDWNTQIAHQQLVKPSVVTKAGRIIKPLNKKLKEKRKKLAEIIDVD